ncbi:MAG TPA: hypothetical protein VFZ53_06250 [Polyangiaceae bacterium]
MDSQRIQVKLYSTVAHDPEKLIPVFHRFIRDKVFDELMIDVADYGHVKDGPGVALIGHASDYFADQSEGRFGLVYTRKREAPPPSERLLDAVRRALNGARLVEKEPGFEGVRFATNELLFRFTDRLRAPNDAATFSALEAELAPITARLYGASGVSVEKVGEPRDVLSARVRAASAPATVDELYNRLG